MRRNKFWKSLDEAFFPPVTCLYCGKELTEPAPHYVCPECENAFFRVESNPVTVEGASVIVACRYEGAARSVALDEKDADKPWLTRVTAAFLADAVTATGATFDCIAYVPSHRKKRLRRGYDHAALMARELSEKLGVPVQKGLKRIREKKDQTKVAAKDRFDNVKNDFRYDGEPLDGKTVLLVDDVVTTGSTMKACTVAMFEKGLQRVLFAAFSAPIRDEKDKKRTLEAGQSGIEDAF